jgi:hypothetical protein
MSSIYLVQPGQSMWDVVLNATGTLANLDQVLDDNEAMDWTPVLIAGSGIVISDEVDIDINALQQLQLFPVCNTSVNDIAAQINTIFETLSGLWILRSGFWDDTGLWIDTAVWID